MADPIQALLDYNGLWVGCEADPITVEFSEDSITIYRRHDSRLLSGAKTVVVMWLEEEWAEDPSIVSSMLSAVIVGMEYGATALDHYLKDMPQTQKALETLADSSKRSRQ